MGAFRFSNFRRRFSTKKIIILLTFSLLLMPMFIFAWDGYDYEKGSYIEIGKGNLVRSGKDIEIYDYGTGEYKDVEVESIERSGNSVEVKVYDSSTGEYRTFEME